MTLTAQGCGMGPYIAQQAEWRIAEIEDVEDVVVDLVFEPPWNPDLITEDGKRLLGIDQMAEPRKLTPAEEARLEQVREQFKEKQEMF